MTYDYGDWDDEHYESGVDTAVTFSLEGHPDDDCATFVTQALDGAVTLRFTLAPQDQLDFLHRFMRFTNVDLDEVRRVVNDVATERAQTEEKPDVEPDPDHERDLLLDRDLL